MIRTLPIALLFALVVGCEDPHNDMGEQEKYVAEKQTKFFADGTSSRPLPPGVVPRDDQDVPGMPYAQQHPAPPAQRGEVLPLATTNPVAVTSEAIRGGQRSYDTFCAVCHGRLGNGEGMIVQRGFTRPPSFHVQRLKDAPDAHFYNVITNGFGAMFSYNDRVTPQERWEIVIYIRALQIAPDLAHASPQDRAALIAGGDRKTPATGGGG